MRCFRTGPGSTLRHHGELYGDTSEAKAKGRACGTDAIIQRGRLRVAVPDTSYEAILEAETTCYWHERDAPTGLHYAGAHRKV